MTRARLQGCFCDPARAHLRCGREGVYCIICHQDSNSSSEISLFLSLSSTLMAESMSDSVGGGIPSCRTPGPSHQISSGTAALSATITYPDQCVAVKDGELLSIHMSIAVQ